MNKTKTKQKHTKNHNQKKEKQNQETQKHLNLPNPNKQEEATPQSPNIWEKKHLSYVCNFTRHTKTNHNNIKT